MTVNKKILYSGYDINSQIFIHLLLKGIKNVLNEMKECDQNRLNTNRFLYSTCLLSFKSMKQKGNRAFPPHLLSGRIASLSSSSSMCVCVKPFYNMSHYEFYERFRLSATQQISDNSLTHTFVFMG